MMTYLSGTGLSSRDPASDADCLAVPDSVAVRVPDERIGQQAEELSSSESQVNGSVP